MSPRVSVGLPVYNGENFIEQAIQSILDQQRIDFELVITDNASVDKTEDICRAFAANDRRIRYVRNDQNIGAAANYNLCFELSSGEFFKWAAHDDYVSPNFLEQGVRALQEHPEAVVAYGEMEYVDEQGNRIPRVNGMDPNVSVRERKFPDMRSMTPGQRYSLVVDAGGSDNVMFGVMRRSALRRTSLHRKYYMSDRALLVELVMLGTFVEVPDIMLFNRDHPDRSTKISGKQSRTVWTNPAAVGGRHFEHLTLLAHQAEIAVRYRATVPLYSTLPHLTLWAMRPFRLGCYALELVGAISPALRNRLSKTIWRTIDAARGSVRERQT